MAAPAFCAPAGWDFHANGHAAAWRQGLIDMLAEDEQMSSRRRAHPRDSQLLAAMKRDGQQAALAILAETPPAQVEALVHATDHSNSTALHWAAEFGFLEAVQALLQAGADVTMLNTAGLSALEYAAKEGHTACADMLAAAGCLPALPRARAALQAVAQAPWRLLAAPPAGVIPRHTQTVEQAAAAEAVRAVRRLLQPHSPDDAAGVEQPYFEAGQSLLQRLTPLDAPGPDVTLDLFLSGGDDDENADAHRTADAAVVALALAGALAAPGSPPLESLRVLNCTLTAVSGGPAPEPASDYHHIFYASNDVRVPFADVAMAALGDALVGPGAPRHVTLDFAAPPPLLVYVGPQPEPARITRARLHSAPALARALRAVWMPDGGSALRRLTLALPRGVRLRREQRKLLCDQALRPQRDAVMAVLLGAHGRCGAQSLLRLLSTELLRRILGSCTVSVRIIETAAV